MSYEMSEEIPKCPESLKRRENYSRSQVSQDMLEDHSGQDLFQDEDDWHSTIRRELQELQKARATQVLVTRSFGVKHH